MATDYSYAGVRRVVYQPSGATFVPVCAACGRFVRADRHLLVYIDREREPPVDAPNATCSKCGRVGMPFEGFI